MCIRDSLLYDEIGCAALPKKYLNSLKKAGVFVSPFNSARVIKTKLQINFRNHRKIIVADGVRGWAGGSNIGDEYRGLNKNFGAWRDTNLKITGPAVLGLQISFFEDWHWAKDEVLQLNWEPKPAEPGEKQVLILHSGPADKQDTAWLMFQHIINSAKKRFWIASPYFVPDDGIKAALQLAVLRGVDVRVLLPDRPDHILVYLSAFAIVGDMINSGVKIYRYQPGFMHQKVFIADDSYSGIGTANLDNRSFRLNFEVTTIIKDRGFNTDTAKMLEADFENSVKMKIEDIEKKPFLFKAAARAAYLLAPVQ